MLPSGSLTSSFTENQIIAAVSGLVATLLLYIIGWPADTAGEVLGPLLRYLSATEHFAEMVNGLIDTQDLVYFVSLILLSLFLTQRSVESRALGGSYMARLGSFYGVVGVILLLFAGVAYFLTRHFSAYVLVHTLTGLVAVIGALVSSRGSVKTFLGERSTKYGASAAVYSLLFISILILVNYLSTRHHHRFDLTEGQYLQPVSAVRECAPSVG